MDYEFYYYWTVGDRSNKWDIFQQVGILFTPLLMFAIFVNLLLVSVVLTVPTNITNFTWANVNGRNFLTPAQNQNNPHRCESGWAFATINTLNTRLNIQMNKQGFLSPANSLSAQVLLECNGNNFGCLGGEPSSALKWIMKNGITDSTCKAYKAKGYTNGLGCSPHSRCQICTSKDNCTTQQTSKVYSLLNKGSVSGEADIVSQILNYGPVACGISATDEFKAYTAGIFTDKTGAYNINHYVSIYGWGETSAGDKYWIAQNSYGPNWGQAGSFRLARGINNLGIESSCYWGSFKKTWGGQRVTQLNEPLPISDYLTPSISQMTPNYCDASYAFAIVSTLSDALLIKSKGMILKSFSVQALLNCGIGTCEKGGDPFQALVFIHKYGFPQEGCQQYRAQTPSTDTCTAKDNCASCGGNSIFKENCTEVKNYKRWKIFNSGTAVGEKQMKIELQNHHALICGIELTKAFRGYTGGIFSENTIAPKVNHYVQVVGFGTDYWVGRAFFGTAWGISGFFKIKMGSQNLGIETKCYWAGDLL